ncbi:MAG TPA: alpha-galactosidase [Verrucomicrobia bacterium]|nr:alpha-galactosidase [Verrucomicrobiota bacterium]
MATIANCKIEVAHTNPGINVRLTARQGECPGIEYLDVELSAATPTRPAPITLRWELPVVDMHQRTCANAQTKLCGMGRPRTQCSAAHEAPVWSMFNYAGKNRMTFAVADAINTCELSDQHAEETACLTCRIDLFMDPVPPLTAYRTTVRFDTRPLPYEDALRDVGDWWAAMPAYTPAPVPEHARLPMYSSWYSFHLGITPEVIEHQCRLAKAIGMDSVIVDDGWQTDDKQRGYAYCGDWEAAPGKFPDFRAHVDRVHAMGMKYLLWFSVPFVGIHTKAYARFKDKFLNPPIPTDTKKREWFTLDPRFPDVREYLIGVYERCLREFDLDGFKLDFVDCFTTCETTKDAFGDGRDIQSVPEAADRLLTDVIARLRAIKPEIMIEFRQSYIGPAMRKYGNIFRVGDEPNNAAGNRVGSMLLRALSGNTAIHSDMVMWHPRDTVESAAMQLLHAVFTVPQISVLLDKIPENHLAMIRHYLAFWRDHRDVLLDGRIHPHQPQHAYPAVVSENDAKVAGAAYANGFIPLPDVKDRELILINGTLENRLAIELPTAIGRRRVRIFTCTGETVMDAICEWNAGLHGLEVPSAGTAILSCCQ